MLLLSLFLSSVTFSAAGQLRGPRFHGDVPLSELIQLHQNESVAQASGVAGRSPLPPEQTCTGFVELLILAQMVRSWLTTLKQMIKRRMCCLPRWQSTKG